jgi:hypothetical protein
MSFAEIKQHGGEIGHFPPLSAEVSNDWNSPLLPLCLSNSHFPEIVPITNHMENISCLEVQQQPECNSRFYRCPHNEGGKFAGLDYKLLSHLGPLTAGKS